MRRSGFCFSVPSSLPHKTTSFHKDPQYTLSSGKVTDPSCFPPFFLPSDAIVRLFSFVWGCANMTLPNASVLSPSETVRVSSFLLLFHDSSSALPPWETKMIPFPGKSLGTAFPKKSPLFPFPLAIASQLPYFVRRLPFFF